MMDLGGLIESERRRVNIDVNRYSHQGPELTPTCTRSSRQRRVVTRTFVEGEGNVATAAAHTERSAVRVSQTHERFPARVVNGRSPITSPSRLRENRERTFRST